MGPGKPGVLVPGLARDGPRAHGGAGDVGERMAASSRDPMNIPG